MTVAAMAPTWKPMPMVGSQLARREERTMPVTAGSTPDAQKTNIFERSTLMPDNRDASQLPPTA